MFVYSLRLLGSNWSKALKLFLYYVVIWGICFALFLPVFFAFKQIVVANFKPILSSFQGVFQGSVGSGLHNLFEMTFKSVTEAASANPGLFVYGLIVLFVFLPFLINVGKYTFCEMLYSYMTSKNQIGFFSALVKGLARALLFALCKTIYNFILWGITCTAVIGIGLIDNPVFVTYFLPLVEFVVLVLVFSLNQLSVLGWMPALIVFNCNIFTAYRKGFKAVGRHFWATFGATAAFFFLFWLITIVLGLYSMVVLVPVMGIVLCVYNMTIFFSSQGMRFYYNANNILTPKRLEEVDNINKTAYIL